MKSRLGSTTTPRPRPRSLSPDSIRRICETCSMRRINSASLAYGNAPSTRSRPSCCQRRPEQRAAENLRAAKLKTMTGAAGHRGACGSIRRTIAPPDHRSRELSRPRFHDLCFAKRFATAFSYILEFLFHDLACVDRSGAPQRNPAHRRTHGDYQTKPQPIGRHLESPVPGSQGSGNCKRLTDYPATFHTNTIARNDDDGLRVVLNVTTVL